MRLVRVYKDKHDSVVLNVHTSVNTVMNIDPCAKPTRKYMSKHEQKNIGIIVS